MFSLPIFEPLEPRLLLNGAPLPDLAGIIDSAKLPAWVMPGQGKAGVIKKVPVLVQNAGAAAGAGTMTIDLYASANGSLEKGSDTLLASAAVTVNLKPGKAKKYSFSNVAALALDTGDYYLLADIDAGGAIAETNEANNLAASGATINWDSALLQRGVSLPLWNQTVDLKQLKATVKNLVRLGVTWVGVNVFWFQDNINSTVIAPDFTKYSASDESVGLVIDALHRAGIAVMLKPLVNLGNDAAHWRGEIVGSEAWFTGVQGYGAFINHWAEIAQQKQVELFCVGTELVATVSAEARWRTVIAGARARYSRELVYAANHGGAGAVTQADVAWWDALDYIGIDAYYPLTSENAPTLAELRAAWAARAAMIETWRGLLDPADQKPVLFTEVGYRSWDGANESPSSGDSKGDTNIDQQEQADCYAALFEEVWKEKPWLRGTYWWNWEVDPNPTWEAKNWYTPQGKLAQAVLGQYYAPGA